MATYKPKPGYVYPDNPSEGFKETQFYQPLLQVEGGDQTNSGKNFERDATGKYIPYGGVYERPLIDPPAAAPSEIIESEPYPLFVVEDLVTTAIAVSGSLLRISYDNMSVSGIVVSGMFVPTRIEADAAPDGATNTAVIVSGTWEAIRIEADAAPDNATNSGVIVSGILENIRIQYVHPGDNATVSAIITGGVHAPS